MKPEWPAGFEVESIERHDGVIHIWPQHADPIQEALEWLEYEYPIVVGAALHSQRMADARWLDEAMRVARLAAAEEALKAKPGMSWVEFIGAMGGGMLVGIGAASLLMWATSGSN